MATYVTSEQEEAWRAAWPAEAKKSLRSELEEHAAETRFKVADVNNTYKPGVVAYANLRKAMIMESYNDNIDEVPSVEETIKEILDAVAKEQSKAGQVARLDVSMRKVLFYGHEACGGPLRKLIIASGVNTVGVGILGYSLVEILALDQGGQEARGLESDEVLITTRYGVGTTSLTQKLIVPPRSIVTSAEKWAYKAQRSAGAPIKEALESAKEVVKPKQGRQM